MQAPGPRRPSTRQIGSCPRSCLQCFFCSCAASRLQLPPCGFASQVNPRASARSACGQHQKNIRRRRPSPGLLGPRRTRTALAPRTLHARQRRLALMLQAPKAPGVASFQRRPSTPEGRQGIASDRRLLPNWMQTTMSGSQYPAPKAGNRTAFGRRTGGPRAGRQRGPTWRQRRLLPPAGLRLRPKPGRCLHPRRGQCSTARWPERHRELQDRARAPSTVRPPAQRGRWPARGCCSAA